MLKLPIDCPPTCGVGGVRCVLGEGQQQLEAAAVEDGVGGGGVEAEPRHGDGRLAHRALRGRADHAARLGALRGGCGPGPGARQLREDAEQEAQHVSRALNIDPSIRCIVGFHNHGEGPY